MGFLVAFSRKMSLTSYIHNIQAQLNDMTAQKLEFTNLIAQLNSDINDIGNSDSPSVKKMKSELNAIEALEKRLDMKIQKLQTQMEAANAELQSADNALNSGIQSSFNIKYG